MKVICVFCDQSIQSTKDGRCLTHSLPKSNPKEDSIRCSGSGVYHKGINKGIDGLEMILVAHKHRLKWDKDKKSLKRIRLEIKQVKELLSKLK